MSGVLAVLALGLAGYPLWLLPARVTLALAILSLFGAAIGLVARGFPWFGAAATLGAIEFGLALVAGAEGHGLWVSLASGFAAWSFLELAHDWVRFSGREVSGRIWLGRLTYLATVALASGLTGVMAWAAGTWISAGLTGPLLPGLLGFLGLLVAAGSPALWVIRTVVTPDPWWVRAARGSGRAGSDG